MTDKEFKSKFKLKLSRKYLKYIKSIFTLANSRVGGDTVYIGKDLFFVKNGDMTKMKILI